MSETQDFSQPPGHPQVPTAAIAVQPRKSGTAWKVVLGILLGLSVCVNILLLLLMMALAVGVSASQLGTTDSRFSEELLEEGPSDIKIATIPIEGLIDGEMAQRVIYQLKLAAEDEDVKAVILRVTSPGGYIASSDQIHHAVKEFSAEKPIVTFMQGIAASGAYYLAVPSNTIVAEPTAITGSIGVIAQWFVLEGLMKDKLGITPVTLKMGQKKDWPSMFRQATAEELQYLSQSILEPAYVRFVKLVADGRRDLSREQVERLADGSVYRAEVARQEKLIDKVGYFKDAIAEAKSLANVDNAQVIQYHRRFSLAEFLMAWAGAGQHIPKLDASLLIDAGTPRVMYLWSLD